MCGSSLLTPASLLLISKMQFIRGGSPWFWAIILTFLQLWGRHSASTSSNTLPPPSLDIYSKSKDSVVLICQAPEVHSGVLFMLYRKTEKVDSLDLQPAARTVQFTVRMDGWDSGQQELFCCLYKSQEGFYSAFSPYLRLERQTALAPPRSIPSSPPPLLSVEPYTGEVRRGDTLSFRCTVPTPLSQSQSQSNRPVTFLLLWTNKHTGMTSVIPQPQASQVSTSEAQPGVFTLGPVCGGEEGEYTCLYQIAKKRGLVNSTVSNVVQITITDMLPVPTLVLQQQTDVWHLLCTGSPAYPGGMFSLFLVGNELPVATNRAKLIHHEAIFPVPVQDTPVALYQCQYSVLLGKTWSNSARSTPLAVTRGIPPPASPGVDWPLVLGSFSAAVLFLCSLALVVVVAQRKVRAAAEAKKRRQEAQFWTQVHAKDHVVDLTLRRTSYTSQEWASGDTEAASRSPFWSPLSTFTSPIHQIH
ncbi:uncharacterized protein [Leuresthes tenuis]|uniref:uncharacterized protein n=1 Tax=Leuresthes tenuis TaxID=355514 RepID=UPI003B50AEF9